MTHVMQMTQCTIWTARVFTVENWRSKWRAATGNVRINSMIPFHFLPCVFCTVYELFVLVYLFLAPGQMRASEGGSRRGGGGRYYDDRSGGRRRSYSRSPRRCDRHPTASCINAPNCEDFLHKYFLSSFF